MKSGHLKMNQPWNHGPMMGYYGPLPHPGMMHHPHHNFCHSCCHPAPMCICGHRECRKEAKELLAAPTTSREMREIKDVRVEEMVKAMGLAEAFEKMSIRDEEGDKAAEIGTAATVVGTVPASDKQQLGFGVAMAYIGGGCCVHLSIEYSFNSAMSGVAVGVQDSESTVLVWAKGTKILSLGKKGDSKPGYYIKEGIITTNPGALLVAAVEDAVARVRWCEVFSC